MHGVDEVYRWMPRVWLLDVVFVIFVLTFYTSESAVGSLFGPSDFMTCVCIFARACVRTLNIFISDCIETMLLTATASNAAHEVGVSKVQVVGFLRLSGWQPNFLWTHFRKKWVQRKLSCHLFFGNCASRSKNGWNVDGILFPPKLGADQSPNV